LVAQVIFWESRQAAERSIKSDQALVLRESLEALAQSNGVEPILDILSERVSEPSMAALGEARVLN
ncbi:MAG: hypothetical protein HW397_455, partial [Dehalococcoidia bacterium]|nr:hypothetical protein [Dehalococcoidia bacterium]